MLLRQIDVHKLVRLRADRLWTQAKLGDESGIGGRTVGRIETGDHRVRPITAVKIARALGVDIDDFSTTVDVTHQTEQRRAS